MKGTKRSVKRASLSIEQIIEQQGVRPIDDLEELSRLWPVDDDPNALLRFILEERRARRLRRPGR